MQIYTLQSITNEVRYIGLTTKSLKIRYTAHIKNAEQNSRNYHVYNWMNQHFKEYGVYPTIHLLDDTAKSIEDLKKLEQYYIGKFPNLTNMTIGGDGVSGYKRPLEAIEVRELKVLQYSLDGEFITSFRSMSEAAEVITGIRKNNTKISLVCNGKRWQAYGYIWRKNTDCFTTFSKPKPYTPTEEHKATLRARMSTSNPSKLGIENARSKPICQKLNGNIVKVYLTTDTVKKYFPYWGVSKALKTGQPAYGFIWEYIDKDIVRSLEKSKIQQ
jgi:hypothetical protein